MSPELALVDAALAAHLRATDARTPTRPTGPPLHLVWAETAVEVPVVEAVVQFEENDPIADLIVQESEPRVAEAPIVDIVPEPTSSADLIVEEPDQQAETSGYPVLPAPVGDDPEPIDATETVLREIRERLTAPPPGKRGRRFRKRFTIASGLITVVALGAFAANVGYGVTQLPV